MLKILLYQILINALKKTYTSKIDKNNEYKFFMSLTETYKYKKIVRGFYNRITEFINISSINKYNN